MHTSFDCFLLSKSRMEFVLGSGGSDIITSDERFVEL